MLVFIDILFTLLHLVIIGFNLFGWIWRRTRKAHLITVILTAGSWFLLGIWYGWGYCFLTDWHWNVKQKLGETNLPNSFIKYFADKVMGMDFRAQLVDQWTLGLFVAIVVVTIYVNLVGKRTV
jgi:hypothetical protein